MSVPVLSKESNSPVSLLIGSCAAEQGAGLGPTVAMSLCFSQLAADPDPNVKSGSELLDRLLKVFLLSESPWCKMEPCPGWGHVSPQGCSC